MTPYEIADVFVRTMNPEMKTDETPNFGTCEMPINNKFQLEFEFIEEVLDCGTEFYTDIYLSDYDGILYGYKCAETMTDVEKIAEAIAELLKEMEGGK